MTPERLGVREYAKHRRCSPSSVVKAISSERLTEHSVTRDARGRPRIDAALADREWDRNTDPNMQRATRRPAPRAGDAVPAWPLLVDLVGQIEEKLSACLHHMDAHAPDAPAGPWETLYGDWALLPRVLELVQAQIIHAAHQEPAR
jgi:hypothetical protein